MKKCPFIVYNGLQKNYNMFDEHSEYTDYGAGFMTVREKHWLAGIQTIQFHNNNPLEEDYYFTVVFYKLKNIVF